MGGFLLFWVLRLLESPLYGGVSVVEEVISRQTDVGTEEITSSMTVSQTFVATDDDLTEVRVFLGTSMRPNSAPLVLTLEDEGGRVVRSAQADPAAVTDRSYHPFVFQPLPDSGGRLYTVTLSSPGGTSGNAFTAWLGNCDCYPDGEPAVNGRPRPEQELAMRVAYHHEDVVVWRELVNRMSQYKPEIMKGAWIVIMAAVSSLLGLASLGAFVFTTVPPGASSQGRPLWLFASVVAAAAVVVLTRAYSGIWGP